MLHLRENTRVLRALLALMGVLAFGIVFAVVVHMHGEEDAEFVLTVNMTLWGVSELNYASQLLAASLIEQSFDLSIAEKTRVASDVVWSRMDMIRREEVQVLNGLEHVFLAYEAPLSAGDEVLYAQVPPLPETLRFMAERVTDIARDSRQTWLESFGTGNSPEVVRQNFSLDQGHEINAEFLIGCLVSILLIYVFVEIGLSKKSHHKEIALRRAASLVSEAKSRFIAAVSHEVRTPLNVILVTADLLADTPLTTEQTRYVDVMQTSGSASLDMLNDILEFSKLEAGQFSIALTAFDPDANLNEAALARRWAPLAASTEQSCLECD